MKRQQNQEEYDDDEEEEDRYKVVVCGTSAEGTIDDFIREQNVQGGIPPVPEALPPHHPLKRVRQGETRGDAPSYHLGNQEAESTNAQIRPRVCMQYEGLRDPPWQFAKDKSLWFNYGFDPYTIKDWIQRQLDHRINAQRRRPFARKPILTNEQEIFFQTPSEVPLFQPAVECPSPPPTNTDVLMMPVAIEQQTNESGSIHSGTTSSSAAASQPLPVPNWNALREFLKDADQFRQQYSETGDVIT